MLSQSDRRRRYTSLATDLVGALVAVSVIGTLVLLAQPADAERLARERTGTGYVVVPEIPADARVDPERDSR